MEQPAEKKRSGGSQALHSLEALRGAVILGVMFCHVQLYFASKLQRPDFLPQFLVAGACIDIFFVLSGFLMVYSTERLFGQPGAMRIYFVRRAGRIIPMYWAATTVVLVYMIVHYGGVANAIGGAPGIDYIICSYLFIPYGHDWGAPLHGVGWSLVSEVFFYVLFGLLVMWSRRTVVLAVSAFFIAIVAIGQIFPALPNPFHYWTHPLILEIVCGMAIALAYRNGFRLAPRHVYLVVAAGLAVLFWSWRQEQFFLADSVARVFIWGLPAVAIVGALALAREPMRRTPVSRLFAFFGAAGYSLYLFHTLGLGLPTMLLGRWIDLAHLPWLHFALLLVCVSVPGLVLYRLVEKPLTDYFHRKADAAPRQEPAPTPAFRDPLLVPEQ
jgi:exopolysaccharide production protein ExoZ